MLLAGRYRLLGPPLGSGSYGAVYLADDLAGGRQVALKVLHPEHAGDARLRARFLRELEAAGRVAHPNVVTVLEVGEDPEVGLWFAMEHVAGTPLDRLVEGEPLPWRWLQPVAVQLAAALEAVHAAGIVHRDVKPQNVMVVERPGEADLVKLLDFGIAALELADGPDVDLTATQMVVGTPAYMSPEQTYMRRDRERLGLVVDGRSDLYQLGLVLYELAAGRRPFHGDHHEVVVAHRKTAPVPLARVGGVDAPEAFCALVDRLLAKDPGARPAPARAVREALEAMAGMAPRERPRAPRAAMEAPTREVPAESTREAELDDDLRPPSPARGRALRYVAVGAMLGGAVVAAVMLSRSAPTTPPPAPVGPAVTAPAPAAALAAPAAPPPAAAPVAVVAEPPAPPPVVTLVVTSDPPGAEVRLDGEARGETPLEVALDAAEARQVVVELGRDGYRGGRFEVPVAPDRAGSTVSHHEVLRRDRPPAARRPPAPASPAAARPARPARPADPVPRDPFERF